MTKDSEQKPGVFYSKQDYAGFWIRVLAWGIDLAVVLAVIFIYSMIYGYALPGNELSLNVFLISSFLTCFLYLAILKRSDLSTLGFRLAKIKIVNLKGEIPSIFTMSLRFLLLAFGPFELLTDLLWLTGEGTKQTLRDKYVGTYVVKRNSNPIGTSNIIQTRLNVLGWNLLFSEVNIPE